MCRYSHTYTAKLQYRQVSILRRAVFATVLSCSNNAYIIRMGLILSYHCLLELCLDDDEDVIYVNRELNTAAPSA